MQSKKSAEHIHSPLNTTGKGYRKIRLPPSIDLRREDSQRFQVSFEGSHYSTGAAHMFNQKFQPRPIAGSGMLIVRSSLPNLSQSPKSPNPISIPVPTLTNIDCVI